MIDLASKDTSKSSDVDRDVFSFISSEDEVIGVEHLLIEPECNKEFVNGVLGFDTFGLQNRFNVEDFSCAFQYDQIKIDGDAMNFNLTQGEETKLELHDKAFQGLEEGVLYGKNSLHATCEEFLLDAEPADEIFNLDCGPHKESSVQNMCLESHSPGFQNQDCGAEKSDLSTPIFSELESRCKENPLLLDHGRVQELQEALRSMNGDESSVTDKHWPRLYTLCGLQNQVEIHNGLYMLECDLTSYDNEGKSMLSSSIASCGGAPDFFTGVLDNENRSGDQHVKRERLAVLDSSKSSSEVSEVGFSSLGGVDTAGILVTQKRVRRPTRRYIEEPLEHKSRFHDRKCEISCKSSRDKFLRFKSHKQHCQKGPGNPPSVCQEKSFKGSYIQVPFDLPVRKGRSKRSTLGDDSEDWKDNKVSVSNESFYAEQSSDESQDDVFEDDRVTRSNTQKDRRRRQHHRWWTLSEVMKLIEGVSQYGVGRWTVIKRLFFSSSSHRSSVDLKDKWRNLLKASCTLSQNKRQVEQGRKQASHQVPDSVLRRVRELAVIYSCPRESTSEISCTDASSFSATTTTNVLVPLSTAV